MLPDFTETTVHDAAKSAFTMLRNMQGEFSCVYCSAPGPHADIGSEDAVAFTCAKCGKSLGDSEVKVAVFATLARIAAEGERDRI